MKQALLMNEWSFPVKYREQFGENSYNIRWIFNDKW